MSAYDMHAQPPIWVRKTQSSQNGHAHQPHHACQIMHATSLHFGMQCISESQRVRLSWKAQIDSQKGSRGSSHACLTSSRSCMWAPPPAAASQQTAGQLPPALTGTAAAAPWLRVRQGPPQSHLPEWGHCQACWESRHRHLQRSHQKRQNRSAPARIHAASEA